MSKLTQDVETDHEYDGIKEFDNPLPRWWLWTFGLTIIFSIFYWITRETLPGKEGTFEVFHEESIAHEKMMMAQAVAPEVLDKMAEDPTAVAAGQTNFASKCASCHGLKAEGGTGPNLTDPFWIHGGSTREIYISIAAGYPRLGMPKWRGQIEETAIQEIVAYVLTLRDTNVPGKEAQGDAYAP